MHGPSNASRVMQPARNDDVWSEDIDLCAYCAQRLAPDDTSCPSCARSLRVSFHRYASPSTNLHVLWVLLAGLAQLYLVSAVLIFVNSSDVGLAAFHVIIALYCFLLVAGIYTRQSWAYLTTVPLLLVLLLLQSLGLLAVEFLAPNDAGVLVDFFIAPLLTVVGKAVIVMQLAATVLAAIWAIFFVGPDFARDSVRLIARLERGLSDPSSLFAAGQRFAKRGMWATAVLHWQRAAALNPTNGYYRQALGEAYLKLGFRRRGLSMLRSSLPLMTGDAQRRQVAMKIAKAESPATHSRTRFKI